MTSLCKCTVLMHSSSGSCEQFGRASRQSVSQGVFCVHGVGEPQPDSAVHIVAKVGRAGRDYEGGLHNIFPTVTSVTLAWMACGGQWRVWVPPPSVCVVSVFTSSLRSEAEAKLSPAWYSDRRDCLCVVGIVASSKITALPTKNRVIQFLPGRQLPKLLLLFKNCCVLVFCSI